MTSAQEFKRPLLCAVAHRYAWKRCRDALCYTDPLSFFKQSRACNSTYQGRWSCTCFEAGTVLPADMLSTGLSAGRHPSFHLAAARLDCRD